MSLWDALRMNMMISYQELVRTFPKLGIDRPSGLTRVMDLASRHPEWHQYVSEVTDWLQPVVSDLMERLPENDTVDIT